MYENLSMVCLRCDHIGHSDDCYGAPLVNHPPGGIEHSFYSKNIMETQPLPIEVVAKREADFGDDGMWAKEAWPWSGPWVITSKIQLPRASLAVKGKKATMV